MNFIYTLLSSVETIFNNYLQELLERLRVNWQGNSYHVLREIYERR